MEELTVSFEPFVDESVRKFLDDGIANHNIAATGLAAYFPANFVLRSADGEVLGGLIGMIWGGWMQISIVWVAQTLRGRGFGSALLEAAEGYARRRDCLGLCLDTFSFQARPFYERHGYVVIATQQDFPPGHARFFMQKRLA